MNVYTYLNPSASELDLQLISLWADSWQAQGWTPRVLTIRDAKKHPDFSGQAWPELFAWAQAKGGWYSKLSVINLSLSPKKRRTAVEFFEGGAMWAAQKGVKSFLQAFPKPFPNSKLGGKLIGLPHETGYPLLSVCQFQSIEQVEQCLAARKKI